MGMAIRRGDNAVACTISCIRSWEIEGAALSGTRTGRF
jgi:hypothetical protein